MALPYDSGNLVYILLFLHGIGTLIPWNVMINAYDYFADYKLKAGNDSSAALQNYNQNFNFYLGIASKVPCLAMQFMNMFISSNFFCSLSMRISSSMVIQLIIIVVTLILAIIDTSSIPETFFWLTMASMVVLNLANGIYLGSVFGTIANMPLKYINAVSLGINICGVVVSIANIISLAVTPNPMLTAIIYFSSGIVFLVMTLVFDSLLKTNKFRTYYENMEKNDELVLTAEEKSSIDKQNKYLFVFLKTYRLLLDLFLIYFVSLSTFPPILVNIKSSDKWISDKYFNSVYCFLVFNLFLFIGTITAQNYSFPSEKTMIYFTFPRLLLIPFFLFCDYRPLKVIRKLPVLFKSDLLYLVANIFLGFSTGHLSSLSLMYAPKQVPPHLAPIAGMMSSLIITVGILAGLCFSYVFPLIV